MLYTTRTNRLLIVIVAILVLSTLLLYLLPRQKTSTEVKETVGPPCYEYRSPNAFSEYYAFNFYKPSCGLVDCVDVNLVTNEWFGDSGWNPRVMLVEVPDLSKYNLFTLRVSGAVEHGIQYDRPLWVFINDIPVFWGSTTMSGNFTAEVDVTLFKELFKGVLNVTIYLPNWIIPEMGLTGYFRINITLRACTLSGKARGLPDRFIPLWRAELIRNIGVEGSSSTMIDIPEDACRVLLFLRTKGRGADEFWYTETPALRNILVYYNDKLIGVYSPFPVIYTGGIFPYYWKPQPSVNTLVDMSLQFFDLTPLALTNRTGNLTIVVLNINETPVEPNRVRQVQVSGGLLIWSCPWKPVNAEYTYYVSVKRELNEAKDSREYSEKLYYVGFYNYTVYHEGFHCEYVYEFRGEARAFNKDDKTRLISQFFEAHTRSSKEGLCAFNYSIKGLYTINLTLESSQRLLSASGEVERYEYSSRDLIKIAFNQELSLNNYKLELHEEALVGGSYSVGLVKTEKSAFITSIYDFSSITRRSINYTLTLNSSGLDITGEVESVANKVNTDGLYLNFKITCKRRE
ncbi:MAG: peptide-N4-asparagine amidase [Desulfurococcaceae archaeon]